MPFRRFFGRSQQPPPPVDEAPADEESVDDESWSEGDGPERDASSEEIDRDWRDRAAALIPGGASTGSKRPDAMYGAADADAPTHFARASGCHVVTMAESTLIDCTMALGAVSLGYADDAVTRAVMAAAANGHVAGLSHHLEVEIAERLCELIPCAEQVRFFKSGAEATAAAVRIARASTGRTHVVASGYFGWHDWSNTCAGVPAAVAAETTQVPFDDLPALERAVKAAGGNLAAIILEPIVEREPSEAWVEAARSLCESSGAVLIFDEMKTGFRVRAGGYQVLSGITPDLATFGKALANGYPLAVVVGRERIMQAAAKTWISSTLAGEGTALAAAGAVLDRYAGEDDVCEQLAEIGRSMRSSVEAAIQASGIRGVRVSGLDPMWMLHFEDPAIEREFLVRSAREGVLFKRGAYNYASLAHGEEEVLVEIERVASSVFVGLAEEQNA
ncbi:MAG: aminotransferase class III-fold pyridoxal phosphate-dependent enzyme [Gemmatimonadaceae bacterium]